MKIIPCKKVCKECGFLNNSDVGVLQPNIIDVVNTQTIFPCHMELKKVTGSENTGVESYMASEEEFRVCRGYLESLAKSDVEPRYELLRKLIEEVSQNMTDNIMTIDESIEYHRR